MDYRACPSLRGDAARPGSHIRGKSRPCGANAATQWTALTYADLGRQVAQLAGGLLALGIAPGDRVALVAENRPEWIVADYAIMAAGAITVPAYTTNTVADHRHVFGNAGVKAVIASTRALAERAFAAALETPALRVPDRDRAPGRARRTWACGSCPGRRRWPAAHGAESRTWRSGLKRTDLACIIHTSGHRRRCRRACA